MNAAARVIHQSSMFHGRFTNMHLSKPLRLHSGLLIVTLLSALAVVYMTNLHRDACGQLQLAEQQGHQLQLQRGQLLLEQASLATPARVEKMAQDKLHMRLPLNKQAFVLRTL